MLQNATPLRKSAPGPPNSSDEHVSCTAPATENASLQILFKCPMPAIVFRNATKPSVLLTFDEVRNPLRLPRNTTSERPKVDGTPGVFNVLTFEMCFAPQQRALFRHLNFKNCSDSEVFCAFWLRHVLRATMACNFSSLIWPAGSAPTALANLLFDPPEPQIIGKTQCFVTFLFAHLDLLSSETFSFLIFFLLLFSSLTLPTSAFQYLSSLTSKLPSTMIFPWIPPSSPGKSPCIRWHPLARVQVACSNAWIFAVSSMSSVATRCCAVNFALPPSAGDGSVFSLPAQQGWEGWHTTK